MKHIVLFTRSMCSGCREVKDLLWTKRRDIYHKVKRFNTTYFGPLAELAYRGLMHLPTFPILVVEYDEDSPVEIVTDLEEIKELILNWPIEEGEYCKSFAPC